MKTIVVSLLLLCGPVPAHHSLSVDFDRTRTVEMKATVVSVRWFNPHAEFEADVEGARWVFTLAAPNTLMGDQGWTRSTLKEGDVVTVTAYLEKKGARRAYPQSVTLPNGTRMTNVDGWEMQGNKGKYTVNGGANK